MSGSGVGVGETTNDDMACRTSGVLDGEGEGPKVPKGLQSEGKGVLPTFVRSRTTPLLTHGVRESSD